MENCLRKITFGEKEEHWKLCFNTCLCSTKIGGLPECPEVWLVQKFCKNEFLSLFTETELVKLLYYFNIN